LNNIPDNFMGPLPDHLQQSLANQQPQNGMFNAMGAVSGMQPAMPMDMNTMGLLNQQMDPTSRSINAVFASSCSIWFE
jgi:hypothetical protein